MKVFISNEGIYNSVRNNISKTKGSLEACRNGYYDIPSGFLYAGRIRSISSNVSSMLNKLERINNALYRNDQNYRNEFSDEQRDIRRVRDGQIKMRRGL